MDVHMFSGSAFVWRVLLAREIKGVAYSEIPVQAPPAALKSSEFLARAKLQAMLAYSRTYPAYWKKLDAAA